MGPIKLCIDAEFITYLDYCLDDKVFGQSSDEALLRSGVLSWSMF
jgi:hypothetical protein